MAEIPIVYTALVGERDSLRDDQVVEGAEFVAFVDKPRGSAVWTEIPACSAFRSDRRNARMHKILAHLFVGSAYSLWIDGNVALRVPAQRLISEWLVGCDLAVFSHPKRSCALQESEECASRALDRPERLREQAQAYRSRGFQPNLGLAETTVVLRRHTERIETFNNRWWSELCRYSVRDQVSFMYALFREGLPVNYVGANVRRHPYFDILRRGAGVEPQESEPGGCSLPPRPANQTWSA